MIFEILKHISANRNNEEHDSSCILLRPYHSLIKEMITKMLPDRDLYSKDYMIEHLTYQVVSFAYNKYFQYVYPFEYKLAKENGLLDGETDTKQNNYFIEYLSAQKEWIEYFFQKYPKLYSILESYSKNILEHINNLFMSVLSDYKYLNDLYNIEDSQIKEINIFVGDLHDGKCVSSITFHNDVKLYYKPRGAANERFLLDTVSLLNDLGLDINIGVPLFLDKEQYSWHMHVNPEDIDSIESVKEYYFNLGKILSLFYVLGTQDIIPDNVICVGRIPFFIDCESVTTRQFEHKDSTKLSMYLQESVMQTGVLPDWMFNGANDRTQVSSILFEFNDKNYHLPHYKGEVYPIDATLLKEFKGGFLTACSFFRNHKKAIVQFFELYNTSSLSLRVLLHPTVIYSVIQKESVTPTYLHGDKNVRDLIELIIKEESYGELRESLIDSLVSQIEQGNVPYYYINPSNGALYTLPHRVVAIKWVKTEANGLTNIIKRLSSFNKKQQFQQLYIIEESVNFFIDVLYGKLKTPRTMPTETGELNKTNLMRAVCRMEKEIRKRMIRKDKEIGLVCRTKNSYDGKFQICLMNDSLYDGMLDVCLFYKTLYKYSSNICHNDIANGLFLQVSRNWEKSIEGVDEGSTPISPLSGITGLLYIMERFPDLYDGLLYASIINKVKRLITVTSQYDYMSGLTGLILLMIQCKRIDHNEKLNILKLSGERLIQLANKEGENVCWTYRDGNKYVGEKRIVLGGFAHGSSSIAIALYLLYKFLNDKRYLILFHQVLSHDRSFYLEDISGWIDGRNPLAKQDSGSWCHGAAGIALSRLFLISEGYTDEIIRKEVAISLEQIEKRMGYNLSVCHGSLGNAEMLRAIIKATSRDEQQSYKWINSIINDINAGKDIVCGDDNVNSQMGLFMGFAGIGYQLLRFYDWENLPSILSLEIKPKMDYIH